MYRIAVDVGGTFTDLVAVSDEGTTFFVKTPSTPHNQAEGVMQGLATLASDLNVDTATLLARTERIVHGMTVATNALLERNGARVGLLTTAGHRDILEMREGLKPERYNLRLARPEPLVPRHLRIGVNERIRYDGTIEHPLAQDSLDGAVHALAEAGVDAVAICFLHAYKNATHEHAAAARVRELLPEVYVSQSSEVLPQIKEYQRLSTTVINAYVGPLIRNYLGDLEQQLATAGFGGPVLIMLSHGGIAPVEEAVRVAAATVLSGPAGGVAGARRVASLSGAGNLIPVDMGGTSTDISMVVAGEASLAPERELADLAIALKSLDIITLGAGGGSIASKEDGGVVQVGPQSAGAHPGPASYGRGGRQATVTDASVVLGYLAPERFMGGSIELDAHAAEQVIEALGERVGLNAVEMAAGVHRIVNTQMAEGIRLATVRRGVDPRRFALLGFGGAAGLHVSALARMLELERVLVPDMASVMSAWGMLATPLRFELTRSHVGDTHALDMRSVEALYSAMQADATARMSGWFDGEVQTSRSADMRYGEQVFEIDVGLDDIDFSSDDAESRLKAAFEARHEALFTYSLPEQSPVLVNARVAATGELPLPPSVARDGIATPLASTGSRRIFAGEWIEVPVYEFGALATGQQFEGPAIVESDTTTVLLQDGDRVGVNEQGWLDIRIG